MRFEPVPLGAALVSGVLLGAAVPPGPLGPAAALALVPLLAVWDRAAAARDVLVPAYAAHLAAAAVAFRWPLAHALPGAAAASLGAWLLLPLLLALPWAAAVPIRRRLGRAGGLGALGALVLVAEGLLARGPWAFPWPLLGHTLAATRLPAQAADLQGVPGLSLALLAVNMLAFAAWRSAGRARLAAAAGALVLASGLYGYGAWRLAHLPPAPADALDVAYLQPALGPHAWADVHDHARVDTLRALTAPLLAGDPPALVVWPETALPVVAPGDTLLARLARWIAAYDATLLTGAILRTDGGYANAALLLAPGAAPVWYAKRRLVPFAEAVPFADRFGALDALAVDAGGVPGYRRGPTAAGVLRAPAPLGIMVCLESVFGLDARAAARRGAAAFVVLTQDGWWGDSPGHRQHLAFTRLRAIETRRAVLQVAVSGTSGLIGADGSISARAGWMERALHRVRLPLAAPVTPFLHLGDLITPGAVLLALALGLTAWRRGEPALAPNALRRSPATT